MKKIRCIFEKTGDARFISHLDLNRVMQRAIRRAGIPVWYTEGFNTHPYITFANPLSLGFESRYEIMDTKLDDDEFSLVELIKRLNETLPEGIKLSAAYEPTVKISQIAYSAYRIKFNATKDEFEKLLTALHGELTAVKKGKAGEKIIDIAQYIYNVDIKLDGCLAVLKVTLPASQEININPNLLTSALFSKAEIPERLTRVIRTELLDADLKTFR